jgi:hypothetical protein
VLRRRKRTATVSSEFGGEHSSCIYGHEALVFVVCSNYQLRDYMKSFLEIFDQVDFRIIFSLQSPLTSLKREERKGGGPLSLNINLEGWERNSNGTDRVQKHIEDLRATKVINLTWKMAAFGHFQCGEAVSPITHPPPTHRSISWLSVHYLFRKGVKRIYEHCKASGYLRSS